MENKMETTTYIVHGLFRVYIGGLYWGNIGVPLGQYWGLYWGNIGEILG